VGDGQKGLQLRWQLADGGIPGEIVNGLSVQASPESMREATLIPFLSADMASHQKEGRCQLKGWEKQKGKKKKPPHGQGNREGPFIANIELPWYGSISSYDNCCYMHGGITVYYTRRAGYIGWTSTREAKQMAYRERERRAINGQRFAGDGRE